jgi:methylmalonyl-CoA/ethylmalonyl-CoA epimerase
MTDEDQHIKRISEISIAVENTEQALADIGSILGLTHDEVSVEGQPPVQSRFSGFHVPGSSGLGVMASTAEGSPIDRFVKKRGEGIFSISLEVDSVEATMRDWQAKGIEFVMDTPMIVNNGRVAGGTWQTVKFNFTKRNPLLHGIVFEIQELHE